MGMKVAAVSVLCQDWRVFDGMWMAGTPCPYKGKLGEEAKVSWLKDGSLIPENSMLSASGEPPLDEEEGK